MSEKPTLSEASTQDGDYRIDSELRYVPKQRRLAKLAYRLACTGPFAFLVMAMMYPVRGTHSLPPLPVQALFWTLCLCSPCGAALGAIALLLFRNRTLGYRRLSVGYAGAGLVVGVLASFSLLLGIPTLDSMRHGNGSRQISCLSNIKQLGIGVLMYTQDYDDRYPLPKTWNDAIYPYTKNSSILHCPSEEEEEKLPTYAMNSQLKGKLSAGVDKTVETVMLFESIPGKNLAGGKALFPNPLRHSRVDTIEFADGHAKMLPVQAFPELIWTPQPLAKPDLSPPMHGENPSN